MRARPQTARSIVFLGDGVVIFAGADVLTDRTELLRPGEQEYHLAFVTDEYDALHEKHREMGVICYENEKMGLYFLEDPDGYWIEIVPVRK